jgi:two-component system response regulator MprA
MGHTGAVRILVVDDEPAVRESLDRALRLEGYETELASNGEQALGCLTPWFSTS